MMIGNDIHVQGGGDIKPIYLPILIKIGKAKLGSISLEVSITTLISQLAGELTKASVLSILL